MKLFLLFFFFSQFQEVSANYTMTDLEVLENQQNYHEFLSHAWDIRPSERNSHWKSMVEGMVDQYLLQLSTKALLTKEDMRMMELLFKHPEILNHEIFLRRRADIAYKFYKNCYSKLEANTCTQDILKFWQVKMAPVESGLKLGKLISENDQISIESLWTFYSPAITSSQSEFHCKKEDVLELVVSRLHYQAQVIEDEANLPQFIKKKIHPLCWEQVRPKLKKQLLDHQYLNVWLSYKILKSVNELTDQDKKYFSLIYLLQKFEKGEQLNQSWNDLKSLGQDYEKRSLILKTIKDLDFLPDKLFASGLQKEKRVITGHIYNHFPEYIKHYAETCLSYQEGKVKFERGNPTLHCKEFFDLAQGRNWVSTSLQKKFRKSSLK